MSGELPFNLKYATTLPGIFKAVTVGLVICALGAFGYASSNADYLNPLYIISCENYDIPGGKTHTCPYGWLAKVGLAIVVLCFLFSVVCYVVLLFKKLNENAMFQKVDFFYHIGGGVALVVACFLGIGYSIMVFLYLDCNGDPKKSPFVWRLGGPEGCKKKMNDSFQPVAIIVGGIFALASGIVFILTGLKLKRR